MVREDEADKKDKEHHMPRLKISQGERTPVTMASRTVASHESDKKEYKGKTIGPLLPSFIAFCLPKYFAIICSVRLKERLLPFFLCPSWVKKKSRQSHKKRENDTKRKVGENDDDSRKGRKCTVQVICFQCKKRETRKRETDSVSFSLLPLPCIPHNDFDIDRKQDLPPSFSLPLSLCILMQFNHKCISLLSLDFTS
jgi:hypothetical protein